MYQTQTIKINDENLMVHCATDKSLTHRAVMFASLAIGTSTIRNPLLGADCLSTIDCFRALGVSIHIGEKRLEVSSSGPNSFKTPEERLDCGNSGTTARLLAGLFAGIPGVEGTLVGDASLSQRPMGRVVNPLAEAGGNYTYAEKEGYLPLTIKGEELKAQNFTVNKASAQIKSAILLAFVGSTAKIKITLPMGSRDHTEKLLRRFGANCHTQVSEDLEIVTFQGPCPAVAGDYSIPVDPSSVAFFAVLALLRPSGRTTIPSMLDNPTRTGFLKVLNRMNAGIVATPSADKDAMIEPTLDLSIEGGTRLAGTVITEDEIPSLIDEIPILAIAAAFAEGPSRFCGLGELRVKESDRLAKTKELLDLAGISSQVEGDDLIIEGGTQSVHSFRYDPAHDHRLAMCGIILGSFSKEPSEILHPECIEVSFPNFFKELEKFGL